MSEYLNDSGLIPAEQPEQVKNDPIHREKPVVHVIVNPAAGQDVPFLKTMNTLFMDAGWDYELLVTKESGDARLFASQSISAGADVIAAFGGDGTVLEVASGMIGSRVPLGILPGGTSNMFSKAFGLPQDFAEACGLLAENKLVKRSVSMGRINDTYFFQLAGIGLEARMVEGADRESKDRLGMLAYFTAALQALTNPEVARYQMILDGEEVEAEGVTCMVSIIDNLGRPAMAKAFGSLEHPDMLDIVVVERADLASFIALMAATAGSPPLAESFRHWRAREAVINIDPPQMVQADGEILGEVSVFASIIPNAVQVLVPEGSGAAETLPAS